VTTSPQNSRTGKQTRADRRVVQASRLLPLGVLARRGFLCNPRGGDKNPRRARTPTGSRRGRPHYACPAERAARIPGSGHARLPWHRDPHAPASRRSSKRWLKRLYPQMTQIQRRQGTLFHRLPSVSSPDCPRRGGFADWHPSVRTYTSDAQQRAPSLQTCAPACPREDRLCPIGIPIMSQRHTDRVPLAHRLCPMGADCVPARHRPCPVGHRPCPIGTPPVSRWAPTVPQWDTACVPLGTDCAPVGHRLCPSGHRPCPSGTPPVSQRDIVRVPLGISRVPAGHPPCPSGTSTLDFSPPMNRDDIAAKFKNRKSEANGYR
jgi:hypothetical protein